MASGRTPAGRPRGGEDISPFGAHGAGLAAGAGSLLLASAIGAYATAGLEGGILNLAVLVVALALLFDLAAVAAGWTPGGWAAVGLLALLYVAIVVLRGPEIDPAAPAVGAGLLLSGELAALARDLFERRLADPRQLGRRLLVMAGLGLATVAVGWVLLVAWVGGLPGGVATTAIGAVAAVGTVAVLLPAARSLVTRR